MSTSPFKLNYAQGLHDVSSVQKETLGCPRWTDDGYFFRYARAGAAALGVGMVGIAPTVVANHINLSVAAAALGDLTVLVTLGATAATLDQYKHGSLMINDGTGQGYKYHITGNPAADSAATCLIQIDDPIRLALVASGTSQASLIYNPYDGVTETTTQTNLPVGVPLVAVPINYYYWAQTKGLANVLTDGTPGVGSALILSDAVSGAVEIRVTALDVDEPVVGYSYNTAGVNEEYSPTILTID